MSSASPYKSKLFNFLNRQSIQWGSRLTQAARRLKITVEWGTQIALYPLYLLVQTSRIATRQFAASQAPKKELAAQTTASISVDDLPTEIIRLNVPTASQGTLQGIACDLTTRHLVFVDRHNELVIPDQSQASLQEQMSLYLGDRSDQQRQPEHTTPQNIRALPPIQPQPHVLPPVRWLLQGLNWLEQSPVAIALDFFGESQWHTAIVPVEIYAPHLVPPLPLAPILQPIDAKVAQLEQQLLDPHTPAETLPLQRWLQSLVHRLPSNPDAAETVASPSSWLTWTDLFKEKLAVPAPPPTLPTASKPPLSPPILAERLSPSPQSLATLTPSDDLAASADLVVMHQQTPHSTLEAQPEWIETHVLSVGYEQHFLERLLKVMDQVLAWLEHTVAKLWSKRPF